MILRFLIDYRLFGYLLVTGPEIYSTCWITQFSENRHPDISFLGGPQLRTSPIVLVRILDSWRGEYVTSCFRHGKIVCINVQNREVVCPESRLVRFKTALLRGRLPAAAYLVQGIFRRTDPIYPKQLRLRLIIGIQSTYWMKPSW